MMIKRTVLIFFYATTGPLLKQISNGFSLISPATKARCSRNSHHFSSKFDSNITTLPTEKRSLRDFIGESIDFLNESINTAQQIGLRQGFQRSAQALISGIGVTIELANGLTQSQQIGNLSLDTIKSMSPSALRRLFENLGATYIKLGQFIASSPTLFPADYVLEFQKCLDKTDTIAWSEARSIIESDLGKPLLTVYSHVNTVPIASASIAQVYEAKLITGEDVVIKVQKPGVADILKTDLGFLLVASRLIELLNPEFSRRLSLSGIVDDIRKSMIEEVDFTMEAKNLEIFGQFLKDEFLENEATCPKVYREASSKKVLTMEKLVGVPLTDLEAIKKCTDNPEGALIAALNTWTRSVMAAPFFHADVHSGNLLVLRDGRVGFIDFGIVGRFSPNTWSGVSGLADALVEKNFQGVAKSMVTMGATFGPVDIEKFGAGIEKLWYKFEKMDPSKMLEMSSQGGDNQEMTNIMLDLVALAEKNNLRLPREFGLLIKQQLYFDRYTRILAPTLDPLRDSRIGLQRKASGEEQAVINSSEENDEIWLPPNWKGPQPPKGFKMTPENMALIEQMGINIQEGVVNGINAEEKDISKF